MEPSSVAHHFASDSAVLQGLKLRTLDYEKPDSIDVLICQILRKFVSLNIAPVHYAV